MADKISASITYLDANNDKGSKAVTDISPTADNGAIKNFCVGLLGLTTNTLSQIDRIEKTDITNATTKPKLTLSVDTEELAQLQLNASQSFWFIIATWNSSKANFPKIYCAYSYTRGNNSKYDLTKYFSFGIEEIFDAEDTSNCKLKVSLEKNQPVAPAATDTLTADFLFTETPATQETIYRLTITVNAGEATLVQL